MPRNTWRKFGASLAQVVFFLAQVWSDLPLHATANIDQPPYAFVMYMQVHTHTRVGRDMTW